MKNRICKIVALLSLFVLLLSSPTLAMAATLSHQYDEVEGYYSSSLVKVKKGKKVGLIDAVSLKVIFPAEYDNILSAANGGYIITKDEKEGYADSNGKIIIPCKYKAIEAVYDGEPILAREGNKLCLLDLKTGEFKPEQAGKMNFYLSALDDLVKSPDDNPSVGLILCRDENRTIAEYALRDMSKPIGVSEYHLCTDLPLNLKNTLPDVEEIRSRIDMKK